MEREKLMEAVSQKKIICLNRAPLMEERNGRMFTSAQSQTNMEKMERKRERDRLRKMTTSLREECEVDSPSSNTISLFLLETDTQSQHTSSLKECQTVLPLKDCAGRENGVNGSEMLLTVLRTQVRFLPFPSCFLLLQFSGPCQKLRMFLSGSTKCWKRPFSLFLSFEK